MNKILLAAALFIFLLFPLTSKADEIHGDFSFGYIPETEDYCVELTISYHFWILVLQGGYETLMEQSEDSSLFFHPYRDTYLFDFKIQPFEHLYFNLSHSCTHAVWSYEKLFYDRFEGGNRTTLSVGIRF